MANPNRLAGTASLTVDGQNYLLVGDFEYNPSKVTRESLVGMDDVHGFSEKKRVGSISGTLRDTGSLTIADLNAMDNVTIVAQLANGKTIIGRNMWTVEDQTVKSTDATVEVKWEGPAVSETTS
ncbi:phage tail protein [Burkholderia ubonensis]|uniref:phage tail tube protein n=1 Tax=Burkholderia ubonensis TaxID=101571 RepID=UPI000755BCE3|nr:phage tail tube protein [Burkholderia ubonensis]KVO95563.1 phage tail protein [Burkholderia ubonensis]KVZ58486.1 phage tail protein [Burkholderia ubonensis]KVZ75121.1 phage tail protein [Burkholderia ubonensis]